MARRNLGVVSNIIESADLSVAYAYEDLVFLTHNAVLLQFADEENTVLLHRNHETERPDLEEIVSRLKTAAESHGMSFIDGSPYTMAQADEENFQINFLTG